LHEIHRQEIEARRRGGEEVDRGHGPVRHRNRIKESYIDCIPALLPYYKALGFKITGQKFFHPENGPSHPMVIDLVKHGDALSREGGMGQYVSLIVKAQAIRLVDRLRGYATGRFD